MKSDLHSQNVVLPATSNLTEEEWREFQDVCKAEVALGGERGEIAARMLDIGAGLRTLATRVAAAVERYCS